MKETLRVFQVTFIFKQCTSLSVSVSFADTNLHVSDVLRVSFGLEMGESCHPIILVNAGDPCARASARRGARRTGPPERRQDPPEHPLCHAETPPQDFHHGPFTGLWCSLRELCLTLRKEGSAEATVFFPSRTQS